MSKTVKMIPDPMKRIIAKQNTPKPPPLGESTTITDWLFHLHCKHELKSYSKVHSKGINPGTGKEEKELLMSRPLEVQKYVLAREDFCGYYYIWILCIDRKTERIIFRANSGDVDFVDWEIPEEKKPAKMPDLTK